jgi:anaerobic selenocysteine-containing dehydrogenase/Fe-S-cluster-containing dehydrogenase component
MVRRDFLKTIALGGTALALGAEPVEFDHLLPPPGPPEDRLPGIAYWFATSCRECPAGCGLIVKDREGRPIKVEGNPLHPISGGKTCPRGQAILQGLYDPDRLEQPLRRTDAGDLAPADWRTALAEIGRRLSPLRGGGRVALISDLQTGSMAALMRQWLGVFGSDRLLLYEPFNYEALREGNRIAFGRADIPHYQLDQADFILSLGVDFLETWVSPAKWIRQFAPGRTPSDRGMSKFVYVGPRLSQTAACADRPILVPPGGERDFALAVLGLVGGPVPAGFSPEHVGPRIGVKPEVIRQVAEGFRRARSPLGLGGATAAQGRIAAETAAAAGLLNQSAGSSLVDFTRAHALGQTATNAEVAAFVDDLRAGEVEVLVIAGANPAYSLPPAYGFEEALRKVPLVIAITPFRDETALGATWVLPANTPLESWGDYEPETGIVNLMQPVMGPFHQTRETGDILLDLAGAAGAAPRATFGAASFRDYLRRRWQAAGEGSFQQLLQRGGRWPEAGGRPAPGSAPVSSPGGPTPSFAPAPARGELSLWLYPMPLLYDGRSANKRWLQEVQDPVTHAVWTSWVELHPSTAARLGLRSHQLVEVRTGGGAVRGPVFMYDGVPEDTIALPFGQGHKAYGRYAADRGFNAFELLAADLGDAGPFPAVAVTPQPDSKRIVTTDGAWAQHGRELLQTVRLSELPSLAQEAIDWPTSAGYPPMANLYPPHEHVDYRWAMVIDLSRCVGCEACMVACYAENNVAVVGEDWVGQGREMYWLRITRYFDWRSPFSPATFLPMLCQHCDAAPCEPVCPVFAASHSQEGLNMQVYNRCIGTRYCNNNCPWKVRRFNWRNYSWPESLSWQLNPDVTVRGRGVMEKCSFCVQRIRQAEHRAKRERRLVRDGEVTPACVEACPAGVFTFGSLKDPNSAVSRAFAHDRRRYQVLRDLNTKPAIVYLKKVFNDAEPV